MFCSLQSVAQNNFVLSKNTPGFIRKAVDHGPVDSSTVISVTVWLKLHNEKQLDQLVQQAYQNRSGKHRQWITQDQFNKSYGPTAQEVNAVQNFLTAHKLSVMTVAENNMYIKVQGAVGDIANAFHVQIDTFSLNGATYRSNTGDPSVSNSSGAHIAAITGMDDYGFQPAFVRPVGPEGRPFPRVPLSSNPNGLFFEGQCFQGVQTVNFTAGPNIATYTGNRYGSDITSGFGHFPPCGYSPAEIHAAYNMDPLYSVGLNGAGETVVITDAFGSGTIQQDVQLFSQIYGLPVPNLQIMKAPGVYHNPHSAGWDTETTLDVEWVHAIAPGANIALVLAEDHASLDEAINYAVVHHLGNTISNSWSSIEGLGNPAQFNRINRILQMAAAQGIDVNFATGDFGDFTPTVGFMTVAFPASSPFATGVGGTSLALNPDNSIAFQTGWGTNITMIANPITQGSSPVNPPLNEGFDFGAGGGFSLTFARPPFQSGLSVAGDMRLVPDISFVADPFTGVEIIQTFDGQAFVGVIGGTSLSTAMFSALMAIAAQKAGHALGQAAPRLYNLPAEAITDITNLPSPNNVTGTINGTPLGADQLAAPLVNTTGYVSALYDDPISTSWFVLTFGTDTSLTTGPGWDDVTGLGTPNGANFVNAIAP